jgi:Yip1 domain
MRNCFEQRRATEILTSAAAKRTGNKNEFKSAASSGQPWPTPMVAANARSGSTGAPMRRSEGQMWANYLRKLVARIKAILVAPQMEWKVIEQEHDTLFDLLISYVAILAAIPEIAHFIGQSFVGGYTPVVPNLLRAVVVYLITFAMVYIIAGVIDLLAPRFGAQKNFANAVKLSAYSHTPLWLAGIFLLVPGLNFLLILGLYGFYLLWIGLPMLMKVPHEKALPYAAAVTACALIPAVVLALI